jgi:hypothetical protein
MRGDDARGISARGGFAQRAGASWEGKAFGRTNNAEKERIMRLIALTSAVITLMVAPRTLPAAPGITAPNATVGRNLQTVISVRLPQVPPQPGLQITVTSDDPSRLLLSAAPDKPGAATITLTARPPFLDSPEFCLQGMGDTGTVTYTVSAPGIGDAKGTVTLAPSAILILGPSRAPKYPMTPRGVAAKLTIVSAMLDSSLKVAQEQQVAGGLQLEVAIASSNPSVGKLALSKLTLGGGLSSAMTSFTPESEGETSIAPAQPPGFTAPAQYASVTMAVTKPGLAIAGDLYLGKDLEVSVVLCLGEPAPPGGLIVTLTSADASKLLLAAKEDQPGSASITIPVPAGQLTAHYFLQGMGDSGIVTYDAKAPGFRNQTARIGLTPSGFIVAYEGYGPPDTAAIRSGGATNSKEFYTSLSEAKEHPVHVVVWTVYLDPDTGRAADLTIQPLRFGVTATVVLESSDPAVGTIESPLTVKAGSDHAISRFIPTGKGKTLIKVETPSGFATPQNATSVPATVSE